MALTDGNLQDRLSDFRKHAVGRAQTVKGLVSPDALGITLMHEHIFIDLTMLECEPTDPASRDLYHEKFSPELLSLIAYGGQPNRDNYILDSVDDAVQEVARFREAGGSTIVDVTSNGLKPEPLKLAEVSGATGVHIVMGCGHYVQGSHLPHVDQMSVEELAREMVADIVIGPGGADIRSGIIGEIGCSWPLKPAERKVLLAAAGAQRETGAAITIHPGRHEDAPLEILQILEGAGAQLRRVIMGHIDRTVLDPNKLALIAATGCTLEMDLFGSEYSYYPPAPQTVMPNDGRRLEVIAGLVEAGWEDQIVIAQDVCAKMCLAKFGGSGYRHIPQHILPRMSSFGVNDVAVRKISVENPARLLAFA